jgi:signal transduction histidine kinase
VKYSPDSTTIRLVARSGAKHAEISVIDRGIGLTRAESAKVFEKFTRADRPEVRKVPGTGLGLYITKSLVELMHGQLWMASEPDTGSTFTFSLPFALTSPDADPSELQRMAHAETVDR